MDPVRGRRYRSSFKIPSFQEWGLGETGKLVSANFIAVTALVQVSRSNVFFGLPF